MRFGTFVGPIVVSMFGALIAIVWGWTSWISFILGMVVMFIGLVMRIEK